MMICPTFLVVFLLLSSCQYASAATSQMSTIVMQLRATNSTENDALIPEMLLKTTGYFDDYFHAFYQQTQPENYFSHTAFSVNSFGIHSVGESYITTLEFEGMLFFNVDPPPTPTFVDSLVLNAFQGVNLKKYLFSLKLSSNEFLHELSHIIVEINSEKVAEENLSELVVEEVTTPQRKYDWVDEDWVVIVFYAACGVGGAALCVILISLCRCCWGNGNPEEDEELPMVNRKAHSKPFHETRSFHQYMDGSSRRDLRKSVSGETGSASDQHSRTRSPSPVRSISSQDSSKFTYNPNLQLGNASVDAEAWERQNGNDISAIDREDKSLTDDGNDSFRGKTFEEPSNKFSGRSLSTLEVRNSRSRRRSSQMNKNEYYKNILGGSTSSDTYDDCTEESDSLGLVSSNSSGDVINDLRQLSHQIDMHRRSTRA